MSNQYLVQPGETLGDIAHRHNLTLGELLQANPQFTTNGRNPNLIHPGEAVHVAIESRFSKMLNVANAILLCGDPDEAEDDYSVADEISLYAAADSVTADSVSARKVVVIDPGHGGTGDKLGGSSANNAKSPTGILEKDMTLQMAKLVATALKTSKPQPKVVLTRTTDTNLGLHDRATVAKTNKADALLSIHFNGYDGQARGVETLVNIATANVNMAADKAFAQKIQNQVYSAMVTLDSKTRDRGVKEQQLGVLNDWSLGNTKSASPCVSCLLEVEFIDVPAVNKLLNTGPKAAQAREKVAEAIAKGIAKELYGDAFVFADKAQQKSDGGKTDYDYSTDGN